MLLGTLSAPECHLHQGPMGEQLRGQPESSGVPSWMRGGGNTLSIHSRDSQHQTQSGELLLVLQT